MSFLQSLKQRYLAPLEFVRPGGYAEIWRIAWPLIAMNASNVVMLLLNRAFLARHQLEDVTAAVPAGQLFFTLEIFFMVTCGFTGTIVAQNYGKKDYAECVRTTWNGFFLGCAVGLLLVALLPPIGMILLSFGNLSEEIRCRQIDYFNTMVPCSALVCMEIPFYSYFTAIGRTRLIGAVKVIATFLGVPLNYIFIFGKCGLPEFGVTGAALASTVSILFSMVTIFTLFVTQRDPRFRVWRGLTFRFDLIRKIVGFGAPGGLQACARNSCFAFVILMFSRLGDQTVAAAGLAMTVNQIAFIPLFGLCDAAAVLTGRYIGERHVEVATMLPFRALRMLMLYFSAAALLYIFAPEWVLGCFQSDTVGSLDFATVAQQVRIIMLIQILQNVFDGIRFMIMGTLRGAGDTRVPLLLTLATNLLVQVPGTLLATVIFRMPAWAAWFSSVTFYVIVDALVQLWRRRTGAWKHIRVIDLEDSEAKPA